MAVKTFILYHKKYIFQINAVLWNFVLKMLSNIFFFIDKKWAPNQIIRMILKDHVVSRSQTFRLTAEGLE